MMPSQSSLRKVRLTLKENHTTVRFVKLATNADTKRTILNNSILKFARTWDTFQIADRFTASAVFFS